MAPLGGHRVLPEVRLEIPGSAWPISPGLPVGTGRVGEFSVEREIVAANLPGQVRTRSGFSIGDARVTIPQVKGRPLAPWARPDRRIDAGTPCQLYTHDEVTGERQQLGAWEVKAPAGSLTSSQVAVELVESQYAGRKTDARLPVVAGVSDPVWMVDQLARQAGFFSTPAPGPHTVLSVPLCGSMMADRAGYRGLAVAPSAGAWPEWSDATGNPGLAGAQVLPTWRLFDPTPGASWTALLTANIAGTVRFRLAVGSDQLAVDVEVTTGTVRARRVGTAWSPTTTFVAGLDPSWPTRVQVVLKTTATGLVITARSSLNGRESSGVTVDLTDTLGLSSVGINSISAGGGVSALDVSYAQGDPARVWAAPSAYMSLLHGQVYAPWLPQGGDVWSALQATLDAYAAAGWVSLDGVLTVLNRHELAGVGRPKTPVDVGTQVEDLSWTLDADDYADRLEVTWWPVSWPDDADATSWQVGDKLHVPARQSVSVDVDLGTFVLALAPWTRFDGQPATAVVSDWDANTADDGSGSAVTGGIEITNEHLSPSSVRVTVTNSNTFDVWMVDYVGGPTMILRANGMAAQESPQVITYGVSDVESRSPLKIDLGKTVQDRATAQELAGYLWGRVNRPRYRLNSIRMPLDWSRDLGDVLTLTHPESDLEANVLVVRDSKTGGPGEIAQRCDLILLPPTLDDLRAAWSGRTLTDLKNQWSGENLASFAENPLRKTEV